MPTAGDCNIMKYKHSERFFINHCVKVAQYHRDVVFPRGEDDDEVAENAADNCVDPTQYSESNSDLPHGNSFNEGVPKIPNATCPERSPE